MWRVTCLKVSACLLLHVGVNCRLLATQLQHTHTSSACLTHASHTADTACTVRPPFLTHTTSRNACVQIVEVKRSFVGALVRIQAEARAEVRNMC